MGLARVVTFEGVDKDRMEQLRTEIQSGDRPEGMPASEVMILHEPESDRALAVVLFDSEEDYRQGDETLNAMPTDGTPGRRTSVTKYDVVVRRSMSSV